ncbi:DUF4382 domain-containing protein [bacterium]|nr:DUF4382 domain-containing protein [bacterium]
MKIIQILCLVFTVPSFFFTACSDKHAYSNWDRSKFEVRMTDAPGNFESLKLSVVKVEAYLDGEGWIELSNKTESFDLLKLTNGKEVSLATDYNAKMGSYSKIKLTFDNSSGVFLDLYGAIKTDSMLGRGNARVELNWMGNNEVEIDINKELMAHADASVLLDFNVAQSIKQKNGKYMIKPMIQYLKNEKTGVKGKLNNDLYASVFLTNGSDTFSTYTNASGSFLLRGMEQGTYDFLMVPKSNHYTYGGVPDSYKIENVVLVDGEIKDMGTLTW